MSRAEDFEQLRPLLFSIAYRILGCVSEAEDAVRETWLRYQASPAQPSSAKAFLSAVVTRVSIDVLRSARVRREEYAYSTGRSRRSVRYKTRTSSGTWVRWRTPGGRPRSEPGPPATD